MEAARLRRPSPSIGIFAPKVVAWPAFSRLIDDCRRHFRARRVVIRWHPDMIGRTALATVLEDATGIVETPGSASLHEVVDLCDWVVADVASNVHLQVLKLGVPTVAISQMSVLDDDSVDLYGFVANRLIFPPAATLSSLPIDAVVAFYGPEWAGRFRRYDAGYLEPEHVMTSRLREALHRVLGECRPLESPHSVPVTADPVVRRKRPAAGM
jgi:hypothetical protein